MNEKTVPQDEAKAYKGAAKIFYATDENGKYIRVPSIGWEAEEVVTAQAIKEFEDRAEVARINFIEKRRSPLEYHMYKNRMNLQLLSQATGFWRLRIFIHFRYRSFRRLRSKTLKRYCDALNIPVDEIKSVPEKVAEKSSSNGKF